MTGKLRLFSPLRIASLVRCLSTTHRYTSISVIAPWILLAPDLSSVTDDGAFESKTRIQKGWSVRP